MGKTGKRIVKTTVSLLLASAMACSGWLGIVTPAKDGLPEKYDLRDDGLVTPVKFQNPWGTCWAFGGIAAMESSILSYAGLDYDSYRNMNGGEDLNLSEKHLAWFALQPVTEDIDPSQKGEGVYRTSGDTDQASYYGLGGELIYIGTLLSSGIGPLTEELFPYRGKEGFTQKDYYEKHPDELQAALEEELGVTMDEYYEKAKSEGKLDKLIEKFVEAGSLNKDVTADKFTVDDMKKAFATAALKDMINRNYYSNKDDWTIEEKDENGHPNRNLTAGFVLKDANTLPSLTIKDENKRWTGINEEGMRAVKKELLEGRGISVGYRADHAQPGQSVDETYMNTDTWSHYTFNDEESTHCVCIVGWDDTYSRKNFNRAHRPPGDGAWIVKNSWGSETEYETTDNGEKIGCTEWGVVNDDGKHTGYFYISYYDKTLEMPETFTFSTNIYSAGGDMYTFAHDYMPSTGLPLTVQDTKVIKTANVFKNECGMDLDLVSFSTKTASPNAQVVYEVYKLKDDAKSPEDGEYLGRRRGFYTYAGFHREDMMKGIPIKDGETFSIVATETAVTDQGKRVYEYAINNANNKKGAELEDDSSYALGVVNSKESYLFTDNRWFDWADVMKEEVLDAIDKSKNPENMSIDNFSIKAYLVDTGSSKK